ncbi:GDSL-type esterase/lipase family protein [Streptomyces sp. NPDC060194]|uniref:GDSL-type esterase/lipase family protein n=1 Tax=Streptomyces sp. NPDC060194 TaxID=3347069 RepID=UPI00365087C2
MTYSERHSTPRRGRPQGPRHVPRSSPSARSRRAGVVAAVALAAALGLTPGAAAHPTAAPAAHPTAAPAALPIAVPAAHPAAAPAPAPSAAPKPPVVVTLGDSYLSGEAGRWRGNSLVADAGGAGTDRTWEGDRAAYDTDRVYGATHTSGCHRSDVAAVRSAAITVGGRPLPMAQRVNLACAGATAEAVLLPEDGGRAFKGERPQAERLAEIAEDHDVELVVLSLGGNDLRFAEVVRGCAAAFLRPVGGRPCSKTSRAAVADGLPRMRTAVAGAVASIRKALAGAGQTEGGYRLVVQSYPGPLPPGARLRAFDSRYDRAAVGRCPFFDADLDWAHDDAVPAISRTLAAVAEDAGAEFLDLSRAFEGREVCARGTERATADVPPSGVSAEWARFVVSGAGPGQVQESLHPNAYGQRALGACLARVYGVRGFQAHACVNVAGRGPEEMRLVSTATTVAG